MSDTQIDHRSPAAIASVYLAGFVQGLALVSFPASSAVLKAAHGLSDAQYGAIFLPQVALAIVGALGGGGLARRIGLDRLLWVTLLVNGLSQALLWSSSVLPAGYAYAAVMLGSAVLGLGFGLSGAPLNSLPPLFFPSHRHAAVVALHTAIGLGLAVGPLLAGELSAAGAWPAFPLTLVALAVLLALFAALQRLPAHDGPPGLGAASGRSPAASGLFWLFAATAVLYAFAEGTFSNWAVIYLQEDKGLPERVAGLALSVFWGAMVVGRFAISALVVRVPAVAVWLTLPVLMILAFLLLPRADSAALGVGLFALAGLACSGFFPLTIALASQAFPHQVPWVSSMMIAALMVGVGLGSFMIGPLRELLPLTSLYPISAVYPAAALALGLAVARQVGAGHSGLRNDVAGEQRRTARPQAWDPAPEGRSTPWQPK